MNSRFSKLYPFGLHRRLQFPAAAALLLQCTNSTSLETEDENHKRRQAAAAAVVESIDLINRLRSMHDDLPSSDLRSCVFGDRIYTAASVCTMHASS
ncbi:unnamed protein product [Sphagnum jensenii]